MADQGETGITTSRSAMLAQDAAAEPLTTTRMSMFQADCAALKVNRFIHWQMRRSGFVAYATSFAPTLPSTAHAPQARWIAESALLAVERAAAVSAALSLPGP